MYREVQGGNYLNAGKGIISMENVQGGNYLNGKLKEGIIYLYREGIYLIGKCTHREKNTLFLAYLGHREDPCHSPRSPQTEEGKGPGEGERDQSVEASYVCVVSSAAAHPSLMNLDCLVSGMRG